MYLYTIEERYALSSARSSDRRAQSTELTVITCFVFVIADTLCRGSRSRQLIRSPSCCFCLCLACCCMLSCLPALLDDREHTLLLVDAFVDGDYRCLERLQECQRIQHDKSCIIGGGGSGAIGTHTSKST